MLKNSGLTYRSNGRGSYTIQAQAPDSHATPAKAPVRAGPEDLAKGPAFEELIITSSRIVREGYNAPTPLSVIGEERIQANANANLAVLLTTLPAFANSASARSSTVTGNFAVAGINSLNLRNLGPNRTLTLLDGNRMTPAHQNGSVDANLIPQQLVQRVDVVTGGGSAVYGSDAIAGVVNFVLDKTFTGLKGEVSAGQTDYDDGQNVKVAISAGTHFAGDRGHLLVSGEYVRDEGICTGSKPIQKRNWMTKGLNNIANPAYTPTNGLAPTPDRRKHRVFAGRARRRHHFWPLKGVGSFRRRTV